MDIPGWRSKIDELDRKLVELLNQRATAAREIGRLKRDTKIPIYEPQREKVIYANIHAANTGPLENIQLTQIYERIIDVMRKVQMQDSAAKAKAAGTQTELEAEINE